MSELEAAALAYRQAKKIYETWLNAEDDHDLWASDPYGDLQNARDNVLKVAAQTEAPHIPTSPQNLDALIQRNEERRRVKATIKTPRWFLESDGNIMTNDCTIICMLSGPVEYYHSPPEEFGPFVIHARNDMPEDDIDQLLALIATLQAALSER